MKAIELKALRKLELVDKAKPRVEKPGDVLLKVERVGVCGSDVHYYTTGRIGSQIVQYPFVLGHEFSGTVVEVGSGVKDIRAGMRAAVDPAMPCFECDQCRAGRENTCRRLKFLGCPGQAEGCLCEYMVMPAASVFVVGDSVTLDEAMLAEPLSIGYYAVKQAGVRGGASIAVLGSGPIGLSCMASAKVMGVDEIYATDKIDLRVEAAKKAGAGFAVNAGKGDAVGEILGRQAAGMDVVFECAGVQETVDQAIELLKPGGKLMLIGIPEFDRVSFTIDKARRKELTIVNVRRQNGCVRSALEIFAERKIDLGFMLTHKFPLEKTAEAFELVAGYRDGVIKAVIEI